MQVFFVQFIIILDLALITALIMSRNDFFEIIVPSKENRKKTVPRDVAGMNTSIASIAAMVAAMVGMIK